MRKEITELEDEKGDYGVGYTITVFFAIAFFIASCAGWVMDIYRFSKCDFRSPYKAEALYGIGIVCPSVGGVFGWIKFKDGRDFVFERGGK